MPPTASHPPSPIAEATVAPAAEGGRACANCDQPLTAPPPKFCPNCGQETHIRPPRLAEFLQQFGGAYLSTEGALWRTLKLLMLKPGELTAQYLGGRRKHYVLPLRLYLTISVLVLLLMRATASIQFQVDDAELPKERPQHANIAILGGSAGLKDGVFYCERLPQWVCKRLQRRMDVDAKEIRQQVEDLGQRFIANVGAAMFLMLPSFALMLKLAYRGRRLHYTEHLVFALHVHAFWFLMLALSTLDVAALAVLGAAAVPVYTLLAMGRVYGGRWWPRVLRAALISVMYAVVMALALVGVGVWAALM